MPIQIDTLPGGGGLIIAAVLTAGVAILAGQEIAQREVANLGWMGLCEGSLQSAVERQRKPINVLPERRCSDVVGGAILFPGPWQDLGNALCDEFGDPDLNGAARRAEQGFNDRAKALEDQRLEHLAANAGTQCGCAASVFRQDHLIQYGLYAGTARFYIPPAIQNLEQSLRVSLGTPHCQVLEGK